jgi:hypothetical protein
MARLFSSLNLSNLSFQSISFLANFTTPLIDLLFWIRGFALAKKTHLESKDESLLTPLSFSNLEAQTTWQELFEMPKMLFETFFCKQQLSIR